MELITQPSAVGFEGLRSDIKGTSNPRVIVDVPHDEELIEAIESFTDVDGEPLPVTVKIEPMMRQLVLSEQS